MTLYRYIFFKDLPGLTVRANLGGVMQLQDRPEHMARCQQTNTYHTRHIYTLAAQDNVRGSNKQISRRSTSATDTIVLLVVSVLHREYINKFVNDYEYSLRIPFQSYHQGKHLGHSISDILIIFGTMTNKKDQFLSAS